jgi:hypothetical protein
MEDDMKRIIATMVVLIAFVVSATAQVSTNVETLVSPLVAPARTMLGDDVFVGRLHLDADITRLANIARSGDEATLLSLSTDSSFLLFGTLSRSSVESEEPFWAVSEFLEGAWIGTSEIRLYRVFLQFRGEQYRDFLEGSAGKQAVVIAKDATLRANRDGSKDVYLSVVSIRPFF